MNSTTFKCPRCDGAGTLLNIQGAEVECSTCHGVKEIVVSHDKKNPTWVDVVFNNGNARRILVDVVDEGYVYVSSSYEVDYMLNRRYETSSCEEIELIKEPKYRAFRDGAEFSQWLRDTKRSDMRVVRTPFERVSSELLHNDTILGYDEDKVYIRLSQYTMPYACMFADYVWFDNNECVGIRE